MPLLHTRRPTGSLILTEVMHTVDVFPAFGFIIRMRKIHKKKRKHPCSVTVSPGAPKYEVLLLRF